ncbi:restriction endonuclease subunit S [Clostridium perfringens]|nr:restriction endonuclease subunit S [Clostridium perfringens]
MIRWKSFPLGGVDGVFNISSTRSGIDSINLNLEGIPKYPYITRTSNNNGIQFFVPEQSKPLNPGNTISLGLDTQTVFYQPFEYYTGQNIQVLSNINLDKYSALFIIPLIKKQLENLNWGGNGATLGRLAVKQIMLPIDDNEQINWNYMKSIIKLKYLESKSCFEYKINQNITDYRNLEDVRMKEFAIEDVFDTIVTGKSKGLNHLKKGGSVPYLSATNRNNGVSEFIVVDSPEVEKMIQKGNCIAFIRNGVGSIGYSIYKKEDFIATSDISVGYNKNLNKYVGTFITTVADRARDKYSFGYKRSPARLKKEILLLPVNEKDEIDWVFMEQYMKRIENIIITKQL